MRIDIKSWDTEMRVTMVVIWEISLNNEDFFHKVAYWRYDIPYEMF